MPSLEPSLPCRHALSTTSPSRRRRQRQGGWNAGSAAGRSWVPCWALPLTSCMTLDKWLRLSAQASSPVKRERSAQLAGGPWSPSARLCNGAESAVSGAPTPTRARRRPETVLTVANTNSRRPPAARPAGATPTWLPRPRAGRSLSRSRGPGAGLPPRPPHRQATESAIFPATPGPRPGRQSRLSPRPAQTWLPSGPPRPEAARAEPGRYRGRGAEPRGRAPRLVRRASGSRRLAVVRLCTREGSVPAQRAGPPRGRGLPAQHPRGPHTQTHSRSENFTVI